MKRVKLASRSEAAASTGLLPHEWLLKVARGEPVLQKYWRIQYDKQGNEKGRELVEEEYYADFSTRVDAAKAAAPYYAPRLTTTKVSLQDGTKASGVMLVPMTATGDWEKLAAQQQEDLKNDVRK